MMNKKKISYVLVLGALGFLAYGAHQARTYTDADHKDMLAGFGTKPDKANTDWVPNDTVTGNILAADFAQSVRDWPMANQYLERLNTMLSGDAQTAQRMMLLSISAGQYDRAADYARKIEKLNKTPVADKATEEKIDAPGAESVSSGHDLAAIVLMAQAMRAGDFAGAETQLQSVGSAALNTFVAPVLMSWIKAGEGKPVDATVPGAAPLMQILHKGLAAEWAGQKEGANKIFDTLSRVELSPAGAMTVAAYDIRNGRIEEARAVLKASVQSSPADQETKKILDTLNQGQTPALPAMYAYHMQGATAGAALAFRDLAETMYAEGAADSALVFAQIGRMIRNDVPTLTILVGNIFADQKRYGDAANAYMSVQPGDGDYVNAQIKLSELRAAEGNNDEAIEILEALMNAKPNPNVAYALGEIYRANKDNKKAVGAFDQAIDEATQQGGVDDNLWSVYFVRGMALDDLGQWEKAEADLKKALEYKPKNPHVLNYLAYSWADRGVNLKEAREMLLAALAQQPGDPFITDSLGWVYFKQGGYKEATVLLERAVSLKPYDSVLNDHLGDLYAKTGRTLEAQYQWLRALEYAQNEKDDKLAKEIKTKLDGADIQEK